MKAWIVSDGKRESRLYAVVFAETVGKVLRYTHSRLKEWIDLDFTGLRVTRCKALDEAYRGEPEMDWFNMDDREAMIKHVGFNDGLNWDIENSQGNWHGSDPEAERVEVYV